MVATIVKFGQEKGEETWSIEVPYHMAKIGRFHSAIDAPIFSHLSPTFFVALGARGLHIYKLDHIHLVTLTLIE